MQTTHKLLATTNIYVGTDETDINEGQLTTNPYSTETPTMPNKLVVPAGGIVTLHTDHTQGCGSYFTYNGQPITTYDLVGCCGLGEGVYRGNGLVSNYDINEPGHFETLANWPLIGCDCGCLGVFTPQGLVVHNPEGDEE